MFRHGIDIAALLQFLKCLPIAQSHHAGIQRDAVALCAAQDAAVLIGGGVQEQMVFSRTVVTAKGTARLNLAPGKGTRIEDKPAPVSRVYDGDFLVVTAHRRRTLCRDRHFCYDGFDGTDIQFRAADTFGHEYLSRGPYVVQVID